MDYSSEVTFNSNNNCSSSRIRLKSCDNYHRNKIVKKSKEYFNNKNYIIEEDKVPLITEIDEDNHNNNINDDIKGNNNINKCKKNNTKVKVKLLEMDRIEGINQDEKKTNIINYMNNTGKRNTKVKNYYRSNNKIQNNTTNNYNNPNSSSTPQIKILNNTNLIYNKSIIKYSTFINNKTKINNQKKTEDSNKNIIRNNFGNTKTTSSNNGIILLAHKNSSDNNNDEKLYRPKYNVNMNKDNNCSNSETIKDLDETPKKYIDNLKIMPHELLNNFTKELNGYLKKE